MAIQQTLSIIKPDAVKKNVIGEILTRFEKNGLSVIGSKLLFLSKEQAEKFYEIHKERPFYAELVAFMTSGPVLVSVLEGEEAVAKNREIMGATNPAEAAEGTIRKDFAESIDANAVHGSDSHENAINEILFFFKEDEIFSKLEV
ncbi:MAG: Nucleoside diphosphate kinase [Chlamydiia bacterium]|nr:Nucleoside diphosphate kinase [Chlamydiia bacterium]MCH9618766.1 Nucleoside diphosphate kinase [Chlamydiia bacterium]MCH9624433.1 Nucleoside diphosphate kinase [Chlamydiia bacterium]